MGKRRVTKNVWITSVQPAGRGCCPLERSGGNGERSCGGCIRWRRAGQRSLAERSERAELRGREVCSSVVKPAAGIGTLFLCFVNTYLWFSIKNTYLCYFIWVIVGYNMYYIVFIIWSTTPSASSRVERTRVAVVSYNCCTIFSFTETHRYDKLLEYFGHYNICMFIITFDIIDLMYRKL